jgi:hypothetical protein
MRILLIACLILAPAAQAQVIVCPKFYPWQDTVIPEIPHGHNGKGVLAKQELSGATWMGGAFNDSFGETAGGVDKVKGGVDIVVPTFAKWFVCWYGGGRTVAWWEELQLDTSKAKDCKIQIRNKLGRDPMDIKLVCK